MSRGGCSSGPEEPQHGRKHSYQDCCTEASPALSPRQLPHTGQGSRVATEQDEPRKTINYLCPPKDFFFYSNSGPCGLQSLLNSSDQPKGMNNN